MGHVCSSQVYVMKVGWNRWVWSGSWNPIWCVINGFRILKDGPKWVQEAHVKFIWEVQIISIGSGVAECEVLVGRPRGVVGPDSPWVHEFWNLTFGFLCYHGHVGGCRGYGRGSWWVIESLQNEFRFILGGMKWVMYAPIKFGSWKYFELDGSEMGHKIRYHVWFMKLESYKVVWNGFIKVLSCLVIWKIVHIWWSEMGPYSLY